MNEYQTEMLVVVLVFAFIISIVSAVMCTIQEKLKIVEKINSLVNTF